MRFTSATAASVLFATSSAAPFKFPLFNGFPNLGPMALATVERIAGGTLPNTPLPTSLASDAVTDFQVIATGETFEVAYFTSLLQNVTNNVPGYTDVGNKTFVIEALKAIRAQEELHSTGANAILKSAGHPEIQPCEYIFPVDNYADAIKTANTFTDLVLGALQGVQVNLATDGGDETAVVGLLGAIIGQEGEQNGVYRLLQAKVPSAAPFLTGSAGQYVYNAINQMFIVPGSCPSASMIDVPIYDVLTPLTMPPINMNSTVKYSTTATGISSSANSLVYMSGQNSPVVVQISDIATEGALTTFSAEFPFAEGFSRGLTVAALVKGMGPFESNSCVADDTLAGPGLIEVD